VIASEPNEVKPNESPHPVPPNPIGRVFLALILAPLFVGLPLVGWGLDDVGGYLGNPPRAIQAIVLLVSVLVSAILFPEEPASKGDCQKFISERLLTILLVPLTLAIIIASPYCDRRQLAVMQWEALRYAGLVLLLPGALYSLWPPIHMGRQYSIHLTIQANHELVTDGPFRFLRHPRYFGTLLTMAGIALVHQSIVGATCSLILLPILVVRIRREEGMLHQEFGARWTEYCRRTWRLLPFVY